MHGASAAWGGIVQKSRNARTTLRSIVAPKEWNKVDANTIGSAGVSPAVRARPKDRQKRRSTKNNGLRFSTTEAIFTLYLPTFGWRREPAQRRMLVANK